MAKGKSYVSINRDEEARWRAESDMRTLVEAEQIKKDPKRLKAATACANDKLKEVASVAALEPGKTS